MFDQHNSSDRLGSEELRTWIRDVPDFPRPGIVFKDITPLLAEPRAMRSSIDYMADTLRSLRPDVVVGIEARGFLFAAPVAVALGCSLAPVRKPGKLPWRSISETYHLEYGEDELQLHEDALSSGERVAVIDDLLATGGTAGAVGRMVEKLGGEVVAFSFLIELGFLHGRKQLHGDVHAVLRY